MTIEEAIKHCEEVAEKNETKGKMIQNNFSKLRREQKQEIDSCLECASEHRQLAEWLKELKELRKNKIGIYGRADAIGVGCANCIYLKTEDYTKRPCGICCYNYSSKFEEVNDDDRL